jgi:arylsulfatase A-like enzyme
MFFAHLPQLTAAERPNFLLVMADDQGWGDMAYNGHPIVKTPNFDSAAASGLRLDRFYAAAPVCSPTRASVMTGRHPNRMGVFKWGYPIRPQETTIAEALKAAGYATAHFGKWHLGSVRNASPVHPGHNGFDEWLSAPNFYDNDPILSRNGEAVAFEGESSVVAAEAAIEWMKTQQQADHPFLAVVWFGSPHSPHRAIESDRQLYADQPDKARDFLGEITGMDRAFGQLRDSLVALGLRDNTLLWYCSDNGGLPGVGSTGGFRGNKGAIYEGGLLVPGIIEWPAKIPEPRTSEVRCSTCDIFPTVLDIVQVAPSPSLPLDGVSLLPLIDNTSINANQPVATVTERSQPLGFWDYPANGIGTPAAEWMKELWDAQQSGGDLPAHEASQRAAELPNPLYPTDRFPGHSAWLDGDWKLHRIEEKSGGLRWELYNLKNDPRETSDLAAAHPEITKKLEIDLVEWLASVVNSLNGADYRP